MAHLKKILALVVFAIISYPGITQNRSLYEKKYFIENQDTLRYRVLYPLNYDIQKKYPLVLFLHGSGEKGSDNESQLKWGADLFLDSAKRATFPAIIVFPQCPVNSSWVRIMIGNRTDSLGGFTFPVDQPPLTPLQLVMHLMWQMAKDKIIDDQRIYVGGLSLGGFGTYELLWRMPDFFTAAFPICGGGNPDKPALYAKNFPIWIFHGGSDPIVPVGNAHLMYQMMINAGALVKYSEYPGVGHDSWKNAFAEPDLLPWLFAQKK